MKASVEAHSIRTRRALPGTPLALLPLLVLGLSHPCAAQETYKALALSVPGDGFGFAEGEVRTYKNKGTGSDLSIALVSVEKVAEHGALFTFRSQFRQDADDLISVVVLNAEGVPQELRVTTRGQTLRLQFSPDGVHLADAPDTTKKFASAWGGLQGMPGFVLPGWVRQKYDSRVGVSVLVAGNPVTLLAPLLYVQRAGTDEGVFPTMTLPLWKSGRKEGLGAQLIGSIATPQWVELEVKRGVEHRFRLAGKETVLHEWRLAYMERTGTPMSQKGGFVDFATMLVDDVGVVYVMHDPQKESWRWDLVSRRKGP